MGKNTVQAKQWLEKCYGDSSPSETIKRWFADFKRGRRDTDDAERIGHPNEAVTPESIKKIHKIVLNDRKVKLHELADIVKISKERGGFILHEHLTMRKLCSKWVPHLLTFVNQKQERVDDSEQCLNVTNRNFCINMWHWMNHGSITSLRNQNDRHLSGQQQVNIVQSARKHNNRLERLWPRYFGMCVV